LRIELCGLLLKPFAQMPQGVYCPPDWSILEEN
jgi:hypothetical protein